MRAGVVLCSLVLALTACVATQGREVPRRPREINAAPAAPLAAGGGGVGGRGGRGLGAPLADGGGGGVGGRGGRGLGAERETLAGRRRSSRGGSSYYQPSGYYYRPDSAASQRHEYYVPDPAYADGSRYGYYGPGAGKVADPRGDAGRPYAYGYPQYSPEHMPIAEQHGRPKAYFDPMDEDNADVNSMDEGPGDDKGEGRPYNPNPYGVDSYYYKEQVVKSDDYTPDGSEPNRDDDSDDEDEKGEVSKQESPSEHGAGEASEQEEELAALEAEAARKPHRYGEVPLADRRLNPAASQQIDPGVEIVFGLSDGREVKSGALPLDLEEIISQQFQFISSASMSSMELNALSELCYIKVQAKSCSADSRSPSYAPTSHHRYLDMGNQGPGGVARARAKDDDDDLLAQVEAALAQVDKDKE